MKPAQILAFALCTVAVPASADVVLINVFEVPPGQRAATIAAWEKARDFLTRQPGYISTELHGALAPNARFELVNVARWETPESFVDAMQAMRAAGVFVPPKGVMATPALYSVIATD